MSNTGGRTWDMGSAPYLPVPHQWQKRYEALREAREKYGLCGLMENHHYGWMPSFLDLFAKNAFWTGGTPDSECLAAIARRDWGEAHREALLAWQLFSEGISQVVASATDQYGPFRCGPAYPLVFTQKQNELSIPTVPWAWHKGFDIWCPIYMDTVLPNPDHSLMRLRHTEAVTDCFSRGVSILKEAAKNAVYAETDARKEQITVAEYILCCYSTAKNAMRWNIAKQLLLADAEVSPEVAKKLTEALALPSRDREVLVAYMTEIAEKESENVARALACQRADSRLGFEASSEYMFDPEIAAWKERVTAESLSLLRAFDHS